MGISSAHDALRELFEGLPDAAVVLQGGRVLRANDAWIACLGLSSADEIIDRELGESLEGVDPAAVADSLLPPGTPDRASREVRYLCPGGRSVALALTSVRLASYPGGPAVLVTARDVTRQHEFDAHLAQVDRLVALGTMSAGVAHEINNPLTYVLNNIEYVAREIPLVADSLARREAALVERFGAGPLASIAQESTGLTAARLRELAAASADARLGAERVHNIARDLKHFSRATPDTSELVDLSQVIGSALSVAANEIRHRARLVKDLGETPAVLANASRLGQVILNLVLNAAQAIPLGNAERNELRVVSRTDADGRAVVEVRDTGEGIPPAHLRSIFDPFFTTRTDGSGTGLGLSICHRIISALGGSIEVESTVGWGSTFYVFLPPAPPGSVRQRRPPDAERTAPRRGRVVVIDDEPAVADVVRRLLSRDHDVSTASRADAVLAAIAGGARFDVILCDLLMPEVTGMEFYERLSTLAPDQAARMIFLTGGAFTPSATAFLQRVPNPRIDKPFESRLLRALVAERIR